MPLKNNFNIIMAIQTLPVESPWISPRCITAAMGGCRLPKRELYPIYALDALGSLATIFQTLPPRDRQREISEQLIICRRFYQMLFCMDFDYGIAQLGKQVVSLQPEQSLLIPLYWPKKGAIASHSLLCAVTKTGDTFRLYMINTGLGAEFHPRKLVSQEHCQKIRGQAVLVFEKIPPALLTLDFFSNLLWPYPCRYGT